MPTRGLLELNVLSLYIHCTTIVWYKNFIIESRLTVVSRKAKKKQHACASSGLRDHYCELFTSTAALKFANAVT